MSEGALFDRVVEASGLARVIAPFTITRLLVRAGVVPRGLEPSDLQRALPELDAGLRVYLSAEKAAQAMEEIRRLAAAGD